MFLILSTPNGRDLDKINKVAPRLITDNPAEALLVARKAQNDPLSDYVRNIFVYELKVGQIYNLHDAAPDAGNNKMIVFMAWRMNCYSPWKEELFDSWKIMEKFADVLVSK